MSEPVSDKPVCVTGASGFVASQLVKELLHRGYRVRGTVRNAQKLERYEFLTELEGAGPRLTLASADLLQPESFEKAVQGCEYVVHTASPYVLTVKDPQKDLVDPAVDGTKGVLEACAKVGGVRRVVLTSSMAAVTDEPDSDHTLTEEDWNEKSSLDRNPYYYSKTLAERAAWDFMRQRQPGFDLVVINPFVVLGPSLTPTLNTSNRIIRDIAGGKYPGIVSVAWGLVDVRDVAIAHCQAIEKPAAKGRYICANVTLTMAEVVDKLRDSGLKGLKLPSRRLDSPVGDFLVRLSTVVQPKGTAQFLRTHLGRIPKFDNSKLRRDLEMEFRPIEETLKETTVDLRDWGHL